jgi:hypothetical protein
MSFLADKMEKENISQLEALRIKLLAPSIDDKISVTLDLSKIGCSFIVTKKINSIVYGHKCNYICNLNNDKCKKNINSHASTDDLIILKEHFINIDGY